MLSFYMYLVPISIRSIHFFRSTCFLKSEFADVCLQNYPIWPDICVFTQTRNRITVMCARRDIVNLIV